MRNKEGHTSKGHKPMGDNYGSGMKNKVGRIIDDSQRPTMKKSKKKKVTLA